jgi:Tfp pilus assembly protein PilO
MPAQRTGSFSMRWVHGALIGATLAVLAYKALVAPAIVATREKETEIARLARVLDEVEGRTARLRDEAKDPRVRAELAQLVAGEVSPTRAMASVVEDLARRDATRGCEFRFLGTEPAVVVDGMAEETPFRLKVVGRYATAIELLDRLETFYPVVHVRSVALRADPGAGYAAETEIRGSLYVIQ